MTLDSDSFLATLCVAYWSNRSACGKGSLLISAVSKKNFFSPAGTPSIMYIVVAATSRGA